MDYETIEKELKEMRLSKMAEEHTYRSVREDIVREYLDRKLPENWKDMSQFERKVWLDDSDNEGEILRDRICLLEIWVEALGGDRLNFSNQDQRELKAIMDHIGWVRSGNGRFGVYGFQRCYQRNKN